MRTKLSLIFILLSMFYTSVVAINSASGENGLKNPTPTTEIKKDFKLIYRGVVVQVVYQSDDDTYDVHDVRYVKGKPLLEGITADLTTLEKELAMVVPHRK